MSCQVCLEQFTDVKKAYGAPCHHMLCKDCIRHIVGVDYPDIVTENKIRTNNSYHFIYFTVPFRDHWAFSCPVCRNRYQGYNISNTGRMEFRFYLIPSRFFIENDPDKHFSLQIESRLDSTKTRLNDIMTDYHHIFKTMCSDFTESFELAKNDLEYVGNSCREKVVGFDAKMNTVRNLEKKERILTKRISDLQKNYESDRKKIAEKVTEEIRNEISTEEKLKYANLQNRLRNDLHREFLIKERELKKEYDDMIKKKKDTIKRKLQKEVEDELTEYKQKIQEKINSDFSEFEHNSENYKLFLKNKKAVMTILSSLSSMKI